MKPTDILSAEHRVIEQVLDCLEKMVQKCRTEHILDKQSAEDVVAFLRNFADRCHHGKEEVHLFPAMEAKGFSPDCGPTRVMMLEHEQGRNFVRLMDESIDTAASGDVASQEKFMHNARGYIDLLREHIQKEDHCLFGMANQAFSEQEQARLLAAFNKVEHEEIGDGVHEKYLTIAHNLAKQYGVPLADDGKLQAHSCGCGH